MIKISNDIDKYIMDDKMRISLDKRGKVVPVELGRTNLNNSSLSNNYSNNNEVKEDNPFQIELDKEIKKITSK